eukprot:m.157728 g.157728  ORF g.157728 m.157728 type:complete len:177 (-) comp17975_c1_seq6:1741-2271(-)
MAVQYCVAGDAWVADGPQVAHRVCAAALLRWMPLWRAVAEHISESTSSVEPLRRLVDALQHGSCDIRFHEIARTGRDHKGCDCPHHVQTVLEPGSFERQRLMSIWLDKKVQGITLQANITMRRRINLSSKFCGRFMSTMATNQLYATRWTDLINNNVTGTRPMSLVYDKRAATFSG